MLREIQEKLQSAITRSEEQPFPEMPWIATGGPLSPHDRVEIYATAWFLRLEESLRQDFELLAEELGDARFGQLVRGFLAAYPPSAFEMNGMGDALPEFFAQTSEAKGRPWLVDLANLERAHYQVEYAVDPDPRSFATLAGLDEAALEEVRIVRERSAILVRTEWDLIPYWTGESTAAPGRLKQSRTLIFSREGFDARVDAIIEPEAEILASLASAPRLMGLLERFEDPTLVARLSDWASRGWIRLAT